MPLQDNLHYFKVSAINPEPATEKRYQFLNWHPNLDEYVSQTDKLKELLATIKTLEAHNQNAETFYKNLYDLYQDDLTHKSEFSCYAIAYGTPVSVLTKRKNYDILKEAVRSFLEHRSCTAITVREWIQALIDCAASRRMGGKGENKLIEISEQSGIVSIKYWNQFIKTDKAVRKFTEKGTFNVEFPKLKKELGISLLPIEGEKKPDIILKHGKDIMIVEAKNMKETGGGQGHQGNNLRTILAQTPTATGKHIMVGSFLDGVYSNDLLAPFLNIDIEKITAWNDIEPYISGRGELFQIVAILKSHPYSFWFNTAGFTEFVKDFA